MDEAASILDDEETPGHTSDTQDEVKNRAIHPIQTPHNAGATHRLRGDRRGST
jgi:hypothetical protein